MQSHESESNSLADISQLFEKLKQKEEELLKELEKAKEVAQEKEKQFLIKEQELKEQKENQLRNYRNSRLLEIKKEVEDTILKERKNHEELLIQIEKKTLKEEDIFELAKELLKKKT
ncbi:MAG: hypothetical protein N3E37_05920 [Candidatus Micrarchaeota archaeon]|nr:hypothetical protein [Candidatus Micrarchaeota archaeon]